MSKIIVVDDELNMRLVLCALLKKEGYELFAAADGQDALKILKQEDVDVVVTDLKMPKLDGMGLLERMVDQYSATPVIIMTAHGR